MQAQAKKVYTFIRTKTWVCLYRYVQSDRRLKSLPLQITPHAANTKAQAKADESKLAEFDPENPSAARSAINAKGTLYNASTVNPKYTEAEKQQFRDDPNYHKEYIVIFLAHDGTCFS